MPLPSTRKGKTDEEIREMMDTDTDSEEMDMLQVDEDFWDDTDEKNEKDENAGVEADAPAASFQCDVCKKEF